jgi:exopolyphosphatase/guanosine-5'-triphosphate,3'-diphosphate pyrophosphatase
MHSPSRTILVATSAVRDAENGALFRERVQAETGHDVRILSGDEEANLIGRGLTADLALRDLRDFHVFDLGGGSLECLAFRDRQIEQAISLRLGCVRLTEKFVGNPAAPIAQSVLAAVQEHTRVEIQQAGFKFLDSVKSATVGTGGTVATVRAILGLQHGRALAATSTIVTVVQLQELLSRLAPLSLAERQEIPGLPSARADVFPVALATLIAVAELGAFSEYRNSLFNLRYGLADEVLRA